LDVKPGGTYGYHRAVHSITSL